MRFRSGGKTRLVCDLAAHDAEAANEGEAVGVGVDYVGRLLHEVSDCVVGEQNTPHFLPGHGRCFRPQDPPVSKLVNLDLFEGALELPPFVVERGEFRGRAGGVVEDGGDEADDLVWVGSVVDAVFDDAARDAGGFEDVEVAVGGFPAAPPGFLACLALDVSSVRTDR